MGNRAAHRGLVGQPGPAAPVAHRQIWQEALRDVFHRRVVECVGRDEGVVRVLRSSPPVRVRVPVIERSGCGLVGERSRGSAAAHPRGSSAGYRRTIGQTSACDRGLGGARAVRCDARPVIDAGAGHRVVINQAELRLAERPGAAHGP